MNAGQPPLHNRSTARMARLDPHRLRPDIRGVGELAMLRTITIGETLHVQGTPVGTTPDGRLMVRVGNRIFVGQAVPRWTDEAARPG
jgi:hypothetical protein